MSLSAESAPLKFSARNETQRRSTFYLTDTIDIDTPANSTEVNSTVSITDCIPEVTVEKTFDSPSQSVRSSRKLVRPKSPPPPIPIVQSEYRLIITATRLYFNFVGILRKLFIFLSLAIVSVAIKKLTLLNIRFSEDFIH